MSQGPGLGFGCPYGSPQGRPSPRSRGPQHPASGPTVWRTCSRSRPPGGPAPGPPSLSPGLPWLGSISSQLPPPQRELSTASGPNLPSFPRGNRAAYRWLRCTPAAEVRPSSEVGDWGSCPAGLGAAQQIPRSPAHGSDTPCLMEPMEQDELRIASRGRGGGCGRGQGPTRGRGLREAQTLGLRLWGAQRTLLADSAVRPKAPPGAGVGPGRGAELQEVGPRTQSRQSPTQACSAAH